LFAEYFLGAIFSYPDGVGDAVGNFREYLDFSATRRAMGTAEIAATEVTEE